MKYKSNPCRGSWVIGNNCRKCEKCIATKPSDSDKTEEKALEESLDEDSEMLAYLEVFREARTAFTQKPGESISTTDRRCYEVLKKYFLLRLPESDDVNPSTNTDCKSCDNTGIDLWKGTFRDCPVCHGRSRESIVDVDQTT